jgi:hypothetical protein
VANIQDRPEDDPPAAADVGVTVVESDDEAWQDDLPKNWFSWKKLLAFTGPGFLMSIAYIVRP